MKPGKELDALIAEKVMGWTPNYPGGWPHPPKDVPNYKKYLDAEGCSVIPHYSTDIAAAWEVVEKMRTYCRHDVLSLYGPSDDNECWFALFERKWPSHDHNSVYEGEEGNTAPHAICLAALKAVGEFK